MHQTAHHTMDHTMCELCLHRQPRAPFHPCWEEEEETSLKEPKKQLEHLFPIFSIFQTLLHYQTTQAQAHNTKSFT